LFISYSLKEARGRAEEMVHLSLVVKGSLMSVGGLVLVEVAVETAVVEGLVVNIMGVRVLPEGVMVSIEHAVLLLLVLLGLGLLGDLALLGGLLALVRSSDVLLLMLGGGVLHVGVGDGGGHVVRRAMGVVVDGLVVDILRSVARLFAGVVVGLLDVMHGVVHSVSVRVLSIVVILDPLVSVDKLVLISIERMVVLVLLEAAVLPVV
jgi:hypothetical protein